MVYLANMVGGYNTKWNVVIASAMLACLPVFLISLLLAKSPAEQYKNVWHQIGGKTCENQRKLWKQAV